MNESATSAIASMPMANASGAAGPALCTTSVMLKAAVTVGAMTAKDSASASGRCRRLTSVVMRRAPSAHLRHGTRKPQPLDLIDELLRRALAAITAVVPERPVVPVLRQRHTRIGRDRHEVAQVARVAHRRVDALVRETAGDDQVAHAQVAQHVIDVGRDEYGGGGFREHDLVGSWLDLREHLGIVRAARHVEARDLV